FTIRAGSSESGNASFGTAVEVDGVRLSNNASFGNSANSLKGVSTNNIASSNIESVEVITGVPSVEYGDMSSGVVKINTRRGKTRWSVTMSTGPRTKQLSLSKGFDLGASRRGRSRGVLNASLERTRSISDPMSPYTAYDRNQLALTWSGQILGETPLRLTVGVTGNLGGLDDRADPDKMTDIWLTRRDDGVRANLTASWLLSKSWITNVELNASASYGDKREREQSQYHSAVSATSLHALEAGYYMAADYVAGGGNPAVRIAPGTWYNVMNVDDRPLSTKVTLKANWARNAGRINSKLKVGADWTTDRNFGTGVGTEDLSLAPTFREWRYCDVPTMTNLAAFAEENLMFRTGEDARLNLIAGLRWDNTLIPASAYGTTSSLSPRFNAKYTFFTEKSRGDAAFLRELSLRASWGVAVKQPSFSVLYPTPSYLDIAVFNSSADANNVVSQAYFVLPRSIDYNADLVWQRNHQSEVGLEANLGGTKVSLAFFYSRTLHAYNLQTDYERFEYTYTPGVGSNLSIPAEDRIYMLDASGAVTVSDRRGALPSEQLPGVRRKQLISRYFEDNDDNPVSRYGLEWVIDFKRIRSLNTTIRLDGTYYAYRSVYTDLVAYSPTSQMSTDGSPYKYIGYYYGDDGISNGKQTRALRTNLTLTTNIPEVRMVLSMKVEASLLNYSRNLSERRDGSARSHVLADRTDLLSLTDASVYDSASGCYTVSFPDTYCSFDDPTPRPFLEDFLRARTTDLALYTDLTRLVVAGTTYSYTFLEDFISPYFSVNFSVTKEIGDLASISFYANNCFNNMGQVYSSRTGTWSSVSSYVPRFHYGLTLRLNF
ncbi:MAG: TonB-dependent receptor, partial [Bacteroidales bacterium]|nr:TonB-dependent receptor [Bacteroidales bacterium]